MIRVYDLRQEKGTSIQMMGGPTAVECTREVKCWSWRWRALMELLIPSCGRLSSSEGREEDMDSVLGSRVTGTMYGLRKGRVSFCVQEDARSPPLLVLELAIPTYVLVREMQSGLLRIALKAEGERRKKKGSLFSEPVWSMYCNGRKVGFAMRRHASETDMWVLHLMSSISTGAGVMPLFHNSSSSSTHENYNHYGCEKKNEENAIIYMRASFERVVGSPDCESFHMINPDGAASHELSIFLLRT